MKFYFAHNGIDDGHPNETGSVLGTSNTIDTTVPGPVEPKHTNYVFIASVALVAVVLAGVLVSLLVKRFKKPKTPTMGQTASSPTPAPQDPSNPTVVAPTQKKPEDPSNFTT